MFFCISHILRWSIISTTTVLFLGPSANALMLLTEQDKQDSPEIETNNSPKMIRPLPMNYPLTTEITWIGSKTTEGDAVMKSNTARKNFGVDGVGIKIGIISDSFAAQNFSTTTPEDQILAGDLPGPGNPNGYNTLVNVLRDDFFAGRIDEGRAIAEIIHDIAPGAEILFHSAFNNPSPGSFDSSIAVAINNLVAAGANIIVDDVANLLTARFQDGDAAQAANAAKATGVAYFSSAGNSADNATRAIYGGSSGGTVNWGTDDILELNYNGSPSIFPLNPNFPFGGRFTVQWTEPYPSVSGPFPTTDFAIDFLFPSLGFSSTFDFFGAGEDPIEFFAISSTDPLDTTLLVRVRQVDGAPVSGLGIQLSDFNGITITDPDDTNSPTIFGQAAAEGAVAVGAHFWQTPETVESFSSLGPSPIFFDENGNFTGELRDKPDITAPNGVTTTIDAFVNGRAVFNPFFGTSAAAPHAAAVAALMLERANNLGLDYTVDALYSDMFATVIDIEDLGFDSKSGFGRIDALAAVAAV